MEKYLLHEKVGEGLLGEVFKAYPQLNHAEQDTQSTQSTQSTQHTQTIQHTHMYTTPYNMHV